MAKTKKDKKAARRERESAFKAASDTIKSKLQSLADDNTVASLSSPPPHQVEYVLQPEENLSLFGAPPQDSSNITHSGEDSEAQKNAAAAADVDEDRVVLPPTGGGGSDQNSSAKKQKTSSRKHTRLTWQALKLSVTEKFGPRAAEYVEEHDGNAEDPFFTILTKMQPNTVPVPRHWDKLRSFLSLQADREEAVGIVPAEVQALGIDKLRATKDRKATPNQIAMMKCFLTGSPLHRRTFHVGLSGFGDIYHEGKWLPKTQYTPGALSQRLRQALSIGPNAPPPWLYSMQAMRRLPPAYPSLRVPGLNAPIPAGAQWGRGQGQWGEPPRAEDNTFLFQGVMDEASASQGAMHVRWGMVPPLASSAVENVQKKAPAAATRAPPPPPAPARAAPPPPKNTIITPTPFSPQAYVPQQPMRGYTSAVPREYVRVQDHGQHGVTVAVGHRMMAKDAAPSPPPPPPAAPPGQQQSSRGTKF